jgi:hypothetical protein
MSFIFRFLFELCGAFAIAWVKFINYQSLSEMAISCVPCGRPLDATNISQLGDS